MRFELKGGRLRKAAVVAGLVCVAFGLLVWGGRAALRHYFRSMMSPNQRKHVDAFLNEPFRVPDAWKETKPYAPELIAALSDLNAAWEARPKQLELAFGTASRMPSFQYPFMVPLYQGHGVFDRGYLSYLQFGIPLAADDWTTISEGLTSAAVIMTKASVLARRPDYQFDLATFCSAPLYPANGGFWMLHSAFRFLLLDAHANARAGRWKKSFESVVVALEMCKWHPVSGINSQLMDFVCQSMCAQCLCTVLDGCDDQEALSFLLAEMNRLEPSLSLRVCSEAFVLEALARMRQYKREGFPVDLDAVKPRFEFWKMVPEVEEAFYRERLSQLGPENPGYLPMKHTLKSVQATQRENLPSWYWLPVWYWCPEARARIEDLGNVDGIVMRERLAEAHVNLVRLMVANRLAKLKTGNMRTRAAELVPDYLSSEPMDPFSGKPYVWDPGKMLFYSVGPDGDDDGDRVLFDERWAVTSPGDVEGSVTVKLRG